jgi:hypothetical protein
MRRPDLPIAAVVLALALLAGAGPAAAQVVRGKVVLAGTEDPLGGVLVRLNFPDGRVAAAAETDTAGAFRMRAPRLGAYTLSAERVGMTAVTTPELRLAQSEEVEVLIQMAETAIPLQPLTVQARNPLDLGFLTGYYYRVERHDLTGAGYVLTRDLIQERNALYVADLVRGLPNIFVVERGPGNAAAVFFRGVRGECTPTVYIDGVRQNRGGAAGSDAVLDEIVRPYELEGVEVYRGGDVPGEFYDDDRCGVILLWTRRDADGGRPTSWRRVIIALFSGAAFMLFVMK